MKFNVLNSYVYDLTPWVIASARAFNLVTCAFNLATRIFSFRTHGFELVTHGYELVTHRFELTIREFELVNCGSELVTCVLLFHSKVISLAVAFVDRSFL